MNRKLVKKDFVYAALVLIGVLALLFYPSFSPTQVLFSNDAPLGNQRNYDNKGLSNFHGVWLDLNWLGTEAPSAVPNITNALFVILGSVKFAKFYAPVALLLLGLSTWLLLRTLKLGYAACVLGGIAACLHTNTLSNACWGLPSRALALMSAMLALAGLTAFQRTRRWPYLILSGFAVGLGISEGYDIGAIFSLYVAAYGIFLLWKDPKTGTKTPIRAMVCVGLLAVFSAVFAAQSLNTLIATQLTGVAALNPSQGKQTEEEKEKSWDEATFWSLPKIETLRVLIPGLFGYRMDTAGGGNYWGMVGHRPGLMRHSGSGEYAGVIVVLVALFAIAQAHRRKDSPFSREARSQIHFWSGAAIVSLLFAYGRYAPFYKLVYHLPYFSTIRNPIKFMHPFECAILVLFGFGLNVLFQEPRKRFASVFSANFSNWWHSGPSFGRKWTLGTIFAFGGCLLGALIYISSRSELIHYLAATGFNEQQAAQIMSFSVAEIGWFLFFLFASCSLVVIILSGWFTGPRLRTSVILVGVLLTADLVRASKPWVVYFDYIQAYASNPVLDFLKDRPFEKRVTAKLAPFSTQYLAQVNYFGAVANDWLQHQFQYYAIQSLDIIQMPRPPEMDANYINAFFPRTGSQTYLYGRLWQLSSTRFLLAQKEFLTQHGGELDPQNRFSPRESFEIVPKGNANPQAIQVEDLTAEIKPNGQFGIFEFTGALPRAKLYSNWIIETNEQMALTRLISTNFDPAATVIVSTPTSTPNPSLTNSNVGNAIQTKYEPKFAAIDVTAQERSILLVNDKYSPEWIVRVDGKEQPLLRCNYIMRGVFLEKGTHRVEFSFEPPARGLYISLGAAIAGLALCGFLLVSGPKPGDTSNDTPGNISS
jgi:hypothetical protein